MNLIQEVLDGRTELLAEEIVQLTGMTVDLYKAKDNVIRTPDQNLLFVGDLHGELKTLQSVKRIFEKYKNHSMVFLGDYADRGPSQLETFNLVMAMSLKYPDRITMLRGNHEADSIASHYGFFWEIMKKKSNALCQNFNKVFEALPIAGYSDSGIFSCHGGIPEDVSSLRDLQKIERHNPDFANDILFQLVWNDPEDKDFYFRPNKRSKRARIFGQKAFKKFCDDLGIKLMIRAHQVFIEGVKFFFDSKLVSVFTSGCEDGITPKLVRVGANLQVESISL